MHRRKRGFVAIAVTAVSVGGALGRLDLIGPNPGTFFALGVAATLSVAGVAYGFWEARRIVRSGEPIGN